MNNNFSQSGKALSDSLLTLICENTINCRKNADLKAKINFQIEMKFLNHQQRIPYEDKSDPEYKFSLSLDSSDIFFINSNSEIQFEFDNFYDIPTNLPNVFLFF